MTDDPLAKNTCASPQASATSPPESGSRLATMWPSVAGVVLEVVARGAQAVVRARATRRVIEVRMQISWWPIAVNRRRGRQLRKAGAAHGPSEVELANEPFARWDLGGA